MLVSTPAEKGLIRRSFDHREAEAGSHYEHISQILYCLSTVLVLSLQLHPPLQLLLYLPNLFL
jgi:hypothetical protein